MTLIKNGVFPSMLYRSKPLVKTSAYTIPANLSGATFTTEGAGTSVTFTLPAAVPGLVYRFVNGSGASDTTVVARAGSDTIYVGQYAAAAGTISSTEPNEVAEVECHTAGKWVVTRTIGPWL